MNVTVHFGIINSATKEFPARTTVHEVLDDPFMKSRLGYPENVEARLGGVLLSDAQELPDNAFVIVSQRECKKSRELHRYRGFTFSFYEGERFFSGKRPHIHAKKDGHEALYQLSPYLKRISNKGHKPKQLHTIRTVIEEHRDQCVKTWNGEAGDRPT